MKLRYIDFIQQSYDFPQEEFEMEDGQLYFHKIPMMDVVEKFGTPLKFTYLPKISTNIQKVKNWFSKAFEEENYKGNYHYCYCTKSSHFSFVIEEALKNDIHLETSYATDLQIIEKLNEKGVFEKNRKIICNGFKTKPYIEGMVRLRKNGFKQLTAILDNEVELQDILDTTSEKMPIGIRVASEEEPKFEFYTSRLGFGYKDILPFYKQKIAENPQVELKMLHFFINTGIRDTAYYWNELSKCLSIYVALKKLCPTLDSFNIGGGFPIKNSLVFDFDYEYMIKEIVYQVKQACAEENIPEPDIYTEFGSYTVGESGGALYSILRQKQQNDKERWNMIDSSFMTTLPDAWALTKRFILLPLHRWNDEYERVFLGGITCDSDDYYNSEQHLNAIYLPKYKKGKPMYIGFFHTGAYQESLGGYGGIQHCLIPNPKHILIDHDEEGNVRYRKFADEQQGAQMLKHLGY